MNKTIAASATILALCLPIPAAAQQPWAGPGFSPEDRLSRRVEFMDQRLDLTEGQQAEIRAILAAQAERRRAERAAVREQIDAVLTDEQRALRDEQIERRISWRIDRLADRLDLSAAQEAELHELMTEGGGPAAWADGQLREHLAAVLTEEQLAQLDQSRSYRGDKGRRGCMR